jgi:hypothetical protein
MLVLVALQFQEGQMSSGSSPIKSHVKISSSTTIFQYNFVALCASSLPDYKQSNTSQCYIATTLRASEPALYHTATYKYPAANFGLSMTLPKEHAQKLLDIGDLLLYILPLPTTID